MIRLNIVVEGQTEETFINKILGPHLISFNAFASARRVETGRKHAKIYRGGMTSYIRAKKDIQLWIKEDNNSDTRFTTMFDFYQLPHDFPGMKEISKFSDPYERVRLIEEKFKDDINSSRFIPYIQLHEYEALLFTDLNQFIHYYVDHAGPIKHIKDDVSKITNPELINDNPQTAPSKRIKKHLPSYEREKPIAGPIIAEYIGLQNIRKKCRHFNEWLLQLESLDQKIDMSIDQ